MLRDFVTSADAALLAANRMLEALRTGLQFLRSRQLASSDLESIFTRSLPRTSPACW